MEEAEVYELRHGARVDARANLLWTYLTMHQDKRTRFTQTELCEVLALGFNAKHLTEAIRNLENRGLLRVDRTIKPHNYVLIETDSQETAQ